MPRVFLCYRRRDTAGYAGRLHEALVASLGSENVFIDIHNIRPGQDFRAILLETLQLADHVMVLIGPGWLERDVEGRRRLDAPEDYVRLEIATALTKHRSVIPVLVGGAAVPKASDLPADLRALAQRQRFVLNDESWRQDVKRLISAMVGEPLNPAGPSTTGWAALGLWLSFLVSELLVSMAGGQVFWLPILALTALPTGVLSGFRLSSNWLVRRDVVLPVLTLTWIVAFLIPASLVGASDLPAGAAELRLLTSTLLVGGATCATARLAGQSPKSAVIIGVSWAPVALLLILSWVARTAGVTFSPHFVLPTAEFGLVTLGWSCSRRGATAGRLLIPFLLAVTAGWLIFEMY
ncbi:MAG: toll/interleukin-1 receptor domain-containing protein [Vicinamibacterales bacterium]